MSVAFHSPASRRALRFGPFRFDLVDRTLSRDGAEIRLPPRALLILEHLLERPQRVVSKEDLIGVVWKDAFVAESSLTEAIGVLRQALGDTASDAAYIQTVHRRGYRFVAAVRVEAEPAPPPAPVLVPPASTPPRPEPARARGAWRPAAAAIAIVALLLAAGALWWRARDAMPPLTRATITLPIDQAPAPGLTSQPVAVLSPDGRRIIYVAGAPGNQRLFLRAIDQFEAIAVPGTAGASAPFFSPDGESVGFFAGGRLRIMRLPGGQPVDLADAGGGYGGWWHHDGSILFATGEGEGIFRIADTGGARRPVIVSGVDGSTLRHPALAGDGVTLLATAWKTTVRDSEVVAVDLAGGRARTLARGVHPRPLPDGRVAYLRDGDLVVAPINGAGPEISLVPDVMTGLTGAGQYSLSATGTLLYLPAAPSRLLRRIVSISPDGVREPLLFEPRAFQNAVMSIDGTRVLATIYERGAPDLWVGDVARGVFQRLTSDGGNVDPLWSVDGEWAYFASRREGPLGTYRIPADGSAAAEAVPAASSVVPSALTADGVLFATRLDPDGDADILTITRGSVREWLATPAIESGARVSPDGRFVAYHSNTGGRAEVYVKAADGSGPARQVSSGGGARPEWSADGRLLFFAGPGRAIHRAPVHEGTPGRPEVLRQDPGLIFYRAGSPGLLALEAIEEERPLTTLNLVVGWTRELVGA